MRFRKLLVESLEDRRVLSALPLVDSPASASEDFSRREVGIEAVAVVNDQSRHFLLNDDQTLDQLFIPPWHEDLSLDLPANQVRPFSLHPELRAAADVRVNDTIAFDLFEGLEFVGVVQNLTVDVNGVSTLTAKLRDYDFAYGFIVISEDSYFVNVDIPDLEQSFVTRLHPDLQTPLMVQIHPVSQQGLPSSSPVIAEDTTDVTGSFVAVASDAAESERSASLAIGERKRDPEPRLTSEDAQIDVMVVYTPTAAAWAATNEGGINHTIAAAMSRSNVVSENSELGISFNLVYAGEVDYTEADTSNEDLARLRGTDDGYMDEIHAIRDEYAADMVAILTFTSDTGGLGYLLQNRYGRPDLGFSLTRVQQASWTYTFIHEIGHNMGAHHHADQNVQPGPTVWRDWPENQWSAGWRWVGDSGQGRATVMTYTAGSFFDDGVTHSRVPYFSNPSILVDGQPAGDPVDGDNARTLREVRHHVAHYRDANTLQYCAAEGLNINFGISQVQFGEINQRSGTSGYYDFSFQSTELAAGEDQTLIVTINNPHPDNQLLVWVDWNDDKDFDDPGEAAYISELGATEQYVATLTAPLGTLPGEKRMRMRLHRPANGGNSTACGNNSFGEVQDYTIIVPDMVAPTISDVFAPDVYQDSLGAETYRFTVEYEDDVAIDVGTLGEGDITVTGPNGFQQNAVLVSIVPVENGTPVLATYQIIPPDGQWSLNDTGVYTLTMNPDQVCDTWGNAVAAEAELATFAVIFDSELLVTTFEDIVDPSDGLFSLREAIMLANSVADDLTIVLEGGVYTLSIVGAEEDGAATGDLDLLPGGTLNIVGVGSNQTIIDASQLGDRVFDVFSDAVVTLEGLTITGGLSADYGGAVRNAGTLGLVETRINGNQAFSGAAVYNMGDLTVLNSSIADNHATNWGGGIKNIESATLRVVASTLAGNHGKIGGAIFNAGQAEAINTTISQNVAYHSGGGFYNTGDISVRHSSIVSNIADVDSGNIGVGGGVRTDRGVVELRHTIVIDNRMESSSAGQPVSISNEITGSLSGSSAYNLIGDASSSGGLRHAINGNIVGNAGQGRLPIGSVLQPVLANHGGLTGTHALVPGSPAVDAGDPLFSPGGFEFDLILDQRLQPRVADGLADGKARIDIGAFELQTAVTPIEIAVTTTADVVDPTDGLISLREAIQFANHQHRDVSILLPSGTFYLAVAKENEENQADVISDVGTDNGDEEDSDRFTGKLDILPGGSVTIRGSGAGQSIIDAQGILERAFEVQSGAELHLRGVTLRGAASQAAGGAIRNAGQLSIVASVLADNMAKGNGGALLNKETGDATIIDSTWVGNRGESGGAIRNHGQLTIISSTFSSNQAQTNGGAIVDDGQLVVRHSTLFGNRSNANNSAAGEGGAIYLVEGRQTAILSHTLVLGNLRGTGITPDDIAGLLSSDSDYNLVGHAGSSGGLVHDQNGNLVGDGGEGALPVATVLDTNLVNHGGGTPTHSLPLGSPAVDAGAREADAGVAGIPMFDQRGSSFLRIIGQAIDIGAFERDTNPPTVMITINASVLTKSDPSVDVHFQFSKPILGFRLQDIEVTGGTLSNLSGSGDSYAATLTATSNTETIGGVTVGTNYTDLFGNAGLPGSQAFVVDTLSPTATVQISEVPVIADQATFVTFTFSEPVPGFSLDDVTVLGGTVGDLSDGTPLSDGTLEFTALFTPLPNLETESARILLNGTYTDLFGNVGESAQTGPFLIDTIRPTVDISFGVDRILVDETMLVTFTFSEPVMHFDPEDVSVEGGALSDLQGESQVYTARFTPWSDHESDQNQITVGTRHTDHAGNHGTGAESTLPRIDTLPPSVQIDLSADYLAIGESMLVRFLFSEAVTGFALEQVTAPSGELSDLSGGPVEFTAVFTPAANVESLDTRIVLEGGYTDLAGNSGMGSESASFVINSIAEPTEDFGDAPAADQSGFAASYPVTKLQDGARHLVGPLFLGRGVMATADGVSSLSAAGDGDDDGVVAMSALVSNPAAPSLASVTVISSGVGKLDAWIDFNQHGAWHGENDRILASVDVEAGLNLLTFVVPQDATPGQTYARFRLSSTGGLLPTGPAIDGEVEDYQVTIVADQEQAESPDLATMLWNPVESGDVAGDGEVRPADALLIINYLNRNGATVLHDRGPWQANGSYTSGDLVSHDGRAWIASRGRLVDSVPGGVSGWTRIGAPFYDVDGDGRIDPADALRVINILNNQRRSGPVGETPVAVPPLGGFNRAGHRIIERQSQDNEQNEPKQPKIEKRVLTASSNDVRQIIPDYSWESKIDDLMGRLEIEQMEIDDLSFAPPIQGI